MVGNEHFCSQHENLKKCFFSTAKETRECLSHGLEAEYDWPQLNIDLGTILRRARRSRFSKGTRETGFVSSVPVSVEGGVQGFSSTVRRNRHPWFVHQSQSHRWQSRTPAAIFFCQSLFSKGVIVLVGNINIKIQKNIFSKTFFSIYSTSIVFSSK